MGSIFTIGRATGRGKLPTISGTAAGLSPEATKALQVRPWLRVGGPRLAAISAGEPAVSQHLKVLASAKSVTVKPQGNRRLYLIKHDGLEDLRAYVESFWSDTLSAYAGEIK